MPNRRRAAEWYRRELADVKQIVLPPADEPGVTESVYHMFVIRLEIMTMPAKAWAEAQGKRHRNGRPLSGAEPSAAGDRGNVWEAADAAEDRRLCEADFESSDVPGFDRGAGEGGGERDQGICQPRVIANAEFYIHERAEQHPEVV